MTKLLNPKILVRLEDKDEEIDEDKDKVTDPDIINYLNELILNKILLDKVLGGNITIKPNMVQTEHTLLSDEFLKKLNGSPFLFKRRYAVASNIEIKNISFKLFSMIENQANL
ncbi:hypothetical protein BpHYR1_045458 [Brachionus plicatilis]|uniref:Uncharacterized protein n=1 Tax=Brachionus plicatilis TaxID=10195 RepID=A0A3M7T4Y5_BRAPC|nr:hypothetical protein BpHYR1_045458 [Brachionus plicatilis]